MALPLVKVTIPELVADVDVDVVVVDATATYLVFGLVPLADVGHVSDVAEVPDSLTMLRFVIVLRLTVCLGSSADFSDSAPASALESASATALWPQAPSLALSSYHLKTFCYSTVLSQKNE